MDSYEKSLQTLELPAVLALLAAQAVSETARTQAMAMRPSGDRAVVATRLGERRRIDDGRQGQPVVFRCEGRTCGAAARGHGRRAQHARATGYRGRAAGGALRAQLRHRRAAGQDEHRLPLQRPAGQPLSGGEDLHLHHRRGRDRRQRVERAGVHPPADPRRERARARCAAEDHLLAELCQGAAGADHHHALRALCRAGQGRAQGRRARPRARRVGLRRDAVHRADGRREGEQRAAGAART